MRKLLLSALLLWGAPLSARNADHMFKEIKEVMNSFEKRFKAIENYMNNFPEYELLAQGKQDEKKATPAKKTVEISSDDEFVTVKLHLGDLDYKDVDIEAEGNSLNGSVSIKDGKAIFYVQNGRMFGLSFKKEIIKQKAVDENNKDEATFKSVALSESTKVESLPHQVCELEKMVANYKDGVLELKFPRIPQKKGKKINVASAA